MNPSQTDAIHIDPDHAGTIVVNQLDTALSTVGKRMRRSEARRVIKTLRALDLVPAEWVQVSVGFTVDSTGKQYIVITKLNPAEGTEVRQ